MEELRNAVYTFLTTLADEIAPEYTLDETYDYETVDDETKDNLIEALVTVNSELEERQTALEQALINHLESCGDSAVAHKALADMIAGRLGPQQEFPTSVEFKGFSES